MNPNSNLGTLLTGVAVLLLVVTMMWLVIKGGQEAKAMDRECKARVMETCASERQSPADCLASICLLCEVNCP